MAFIKSVPLDNTLQDCYTAIDFIKQEYRLLKLIYMDYHLIS